MKMLFMTNLYPKENEDMIRKKMKFNMYDAANIFQWNIVNGIDKNGFNKMKLYNHIPVDSYPQYFADWLVKGFEFSRNGESKDMNVGFLNIKFLKRIFIDFPFVNKASKDVKKEKYDVILIYSLYPTFLKSIKKIKRQNNNMKAVAIVADLPQFTSPKKSIIQRFFIKYNSNKIQKLIRNLDGFVLLTDQMSKKLGVDKPYIVVEGMLNAEYKGGNYGIKTEENIVFYSGSLNRQYGIVTLLQAFHSIPYDNYRLVLCGLGNAEEVVNQYCSIDKRIIFKGKVNYDEVIDLQQKSTVLINPRQNIEEFTKYSFPSKTMEYLASGVPVIGYKLDGIPHEYDEYINYVYDNSSESLAKKIIELCEKTYEERKIIGDRGKEFVITQKNNIIQSKKILDFIDNIITK